MSDAPKPPPSPTVRLKGEKIILKLGSEQCILDLSGDCMSGGAWNLMNAIHSRIQEVKAKRNRSTQDWIVEQDRQWVAQEKEWQRERAERDREVATILLESGLTPDEVAEITGARK